MGDLEIEHDNRWALLRALAEGQEEPAWGHAKALAKSVIDDKVVVLAKPLLDEGPFALRRAVERAEVVLERDGDASEVWSKQGKGS